MAVPTGEIYLLSNVILSPTYENTIDFADRDEQFEYFSSFVSHNLGRNYTYVRKEREYISVSKTMLELEDVNYMIFKSKEGERLYYAFVTNKRYVNDNMTEISFTLDVMQTYMFDYSWRPSYIKQAHVDRWTADHKPIYSKTDEGLDYGTEYSVENGFRIQQSTLCKWLLVSLTDYSEEEGEGHNTEGGTLNPVPTPFATFFVPVPLKAKADGSAYDVYVNGSPVATYNDLIKTMLAGTLGNRIQSISLLSYNPFLYEGETLDDDNARINVLLDLVNVTFERRTFKYAGTATRPFLVLLTVPESLLIGAQTLARANWDIGLEETLPTSKEWEEIRKKPYTTKRDKRFESKLLCAPYRYNILTDWRNSPIVFKNEYMTTDKIEVKFTYGLSANAPFRYWIKDYKKDIEGRYTCLKQPLALEMPIISDKYATYMLENKNTIQANVTNASINAVAGTINGAISGGGMGGPKGAIFGAVSGAASGILNVSAMIRSENAKQTDLQAKPDTILSSTDSGFSINDKSTDIAFYRMRICCENEEIIAQIFNMQGYRVNKVDKPNTRSRTRFNYIQTVGANIVGSINQTDLMKIKSIYDNGITIWHYTKKDFNPLDYSYENLETNLL